MKSVQLKLAGKTEEIDATALADSLSDTIKLIRSIGGKNTQCSIGDLRTGSVVIDICAPTETVETVFSGLESIQRGQPMPRCWTDRSLEILSRMGGLLDRTGVTDVFLGPPSHPIRLDREFQKKVSIAIAPKLRSIGHVNGRLFRYDNRKGVTKAALELPDTNTVVEVLASESLAAQLIQCLEKDTQVFGVLHRQPGSNRILKVDAQRIQPRQKTKRHKNLSEFRGALSQYWPKNLDPAEAVRRHREA